MTQLFQHPYARFLQKVEKPNRYTGAEHGVRRKDWPATKARVCLAFPEIYDIGMSHLGFRILYRILNDHPGILAERCYAPWIDLQEQLHAHGKLLVSLESARPLCDFDVVGFSLQYELTYSNVLGMLQLGGIPLRSEHRSDDDPLVIAGGPVATHAEPMADFFDAILIGDGEEAATEIALAWTEAKREGLPRHERLERLAQIGGVYVPSLYERAVDADTGLEVVTGAKRGADGKPRAPFPVERRLLDDIDRFPFPETGPVGGPEAIFDRMSIEVARGCTEGCRFCQAGMIYRPVRERDPEKIVATVLGALEKSGQDEVSLTALSTADVSCISPLIKKLVEKTAPERVSLGVASLRAYGLGEDLLDELRKVRASGLTFAPEAGTQRMRDVINKNVTEAQLMETAERTFSRGFSRMKLYFICGLPTETDEDVLGIVEVGKNALAVGKRLGKRPKVTVSVSVHVPKPHTPFQWCAMDSLETIAHKQRLLRDEARRAKGLVLRLHHSEASVLEGVLARGDRRLGDVIEHAFLHGARFDSWDDQLSMPLWQQAFEHYEVDTTKYLGTLPVGARLPWDHFDIGLEDGFLAREYRKALKSRLSPPCGKAVGMFVHHTNVADAAADRRRLVCYDCGVACDLTTMREQRIGLLQRMGAHGPAQAPHDEAKSHIGEAERDEPVANRYAAPTLNATQPGPVPGPGDPEQPEGPAHDPHPVPDPLPAPHPWPDPVPEDPKPKGHNPEALRPQRVGPPPVKWRLSFEKTGPAALLGHLDLIRELPRVIRRAGVRTAYTQGYHPKPAMSFGPALSLGIASLDEHVDAKLIDAPEPAELLERLARASAGGLRFTGARPLQAGEPNLAHTIEGARYVIAFAASALEPLGGRAELERRVASFLADDSRVVRRTIKGIGKNVDVRALVRSMRVGGAAAEAALERAGLVGRILPLEVDIAISPAGSTKISEVVQVLFADDMPYEALRIAMLKRETTSTPASEAHGATAAAPV